MNEDRPNLSGEPWFRDAALTRVLSLLNDGGGETRIVGGAIRNALIGMPVADVDLATTLLPEEVVRRAEAAGIRAVPTGFDHGTVTLVLDGRGYEVTTLRRDVVTTGRHAEVAFGTDWKADAERRDFTMNALYADASGRIHDPVGGLADIATRTVRFIGEAERRIAEDHLRILRFFRFFAWYGNGRPDAEALKACTRLRDRLAALSAERVWKETKALLSAPDPGRSLLWMRQTGILGRILPETEKWGIDAVAGLVSAERDLGWTVDPLLRLMAMVPPDTARMDALAERLKMSRTEAHRLRAWSETAAPPPALAATALDRLLYRHGRQAVSDRLRLSIAIIRARPPASVGADEMLDLARLGQLLARAQQWERPVFPLSGKDLVAAGMQPGSQLGARLKAAEAEWVASNFTLDRERLLALATGGP